MVGGTSMVYAEILVLFLLLHHISFRQIDLSENAPPVGNKSIGER